MIFIVIGVIVAVAVGAFFAGGLLRVDGKIIGEPGLREAKLSYNPTIMLEKFQLEIL